VGAASAILPVQNSAMSLHDSYGNSGRQKNDLPRSENGILHSDTINIPTPKFGRNILGCCTLNVTINMSASEVVKISHVECQKKLHDKRELDLA
jgi:hypothetical protein